MAFHSGQQSVDANCNATFRDLIGGHMADHGFTLVDTWTSSTITCKVYKSAAADNGEVDFYVGLYTASDTQTALYLILSEGYDVANHKFKQFVPPTPTTAAGYIPESTNYCYNDSVGQLPNAAVIYRPPINIASFAFNWWLSVNSKRVIIGTRVQGSDYAIYAGLVDNQIDETLFSASSVALWYGHLLNSTKGSTDSGPQAAGGGMTREPGQTVANGGNWATTIVSSHWWWPVVDSAPTYDSIWHPANAAFRVPLFASREQAYYPRALLPADVVAVPKQSQQNTNGDTITLDGVTYRCMKYGSIASFYVDTTA